MALQCNITKLWWPTSRSRRLALAREWFFPATHRAYRLPRAVRPRWRRDVSRRRTETARVPQWLRQVLLVI